MNGFFTGNNTLYREGEDGVYQLVLHQSDCTPEEFNKVCNILSEYGNKEAAFDNYTGFFSEHCECIVKEHAIHILSRL